MLRGVLSGADLIHDFGFGGQDDRIFTVQQALDVPVIVGHMRGNVGNYNSPEVPATYDYGYGKVQDVKHNDVYSSNARRSDGGGSGANGTNGSYSNPFLAGIAFDFEQYLHHASKSGVAMYNTILDPGIGISKTHQVDLALPNHLTSLLPPALPLPMMVSTTKIPSITKLLHTTELTMSQNLQAVAETQEVKIQQVKRYFADPRNHDAIRAKMRAQHRRDKRTSAGDHATRRYDPMDDAIKAVQITADPTISFSFTPTTKPQVVQDPLHYGPHGHRQYDPWTYKHTITRELTDLIKHMRYTYKNEQQMLENALISTALHATPQNGLMTQIEMYSGTASRLAIIQSNSPRHARLGIEMVNVLNGVDMVVQESGMEMAMVTQRAEYEKQEQERKLNKAKAMGMVDRFTGEGKRGVEFKM